MFNKKLWFRRLNAHQILFVPVSKILNESIDYEWATCPTCEGDGFLVETPYNLKKCWACNGENDIPSLLNTKDIDALFEYRCSVEKK